MKTGAKIFTGLITVVIAIILTVFCVMCIEDYEHYRRVYQDPIVVTARVTNHEDRSDSESDSYCAQITYTVNGKTYSNVDYETAGSRKSLPAIGEVVQVEVSPEEPGVLLKSLKNNVGVMIALLTVPLAAYVIAGIWRSCRSKDLFGRPDEDTVRRDIRLTIGGRMSRYSWFLILIGMEVLRWRYPMIFGEGWIAVSVVAGLCWAKCLYNAIRDGVKLSRGEYTLRRDVLVKKEESYDSDNGTSYILHYSSGEASWKRSVSSVVFKTVKEGDTVIAVYLEGKKKPILHYDFEGDAC